MPKSAESQAEALCRALIEEIPGPAGILETNGRLLLANAAFCSVFGVSFESARGCTMEQILTPGSSAWIFFNDRLENAAECQQPLSFDLKFERGASQQHLRLQLKSLGEWLLLTSLAPAKSETQQPADDESALRYSEIKRCPPALVALVEKALGDFIGRINSVLKTRDSRLLSSQLHGLKGTTLMVGLKSIANRVHALESALLQDGAAARFQGGEFDPTINELTQDMAETRRLFAAAHASGSAVSATTGDVYDSVQRLFSKYDQLISSRPSFGARIAAERIDWAIRNVSRSPVSDLRDFFINQVQTAAETTGKKVEVDWQNEALPIDEDSRRILVEVFTHLATNSVVHGLEASPERKARGKSEIGQVRVNIRFDGSVIQGTITDDGGGIDPDKIKAHALKKGMRAEAELQALDDDAALHLIFEHGFSTTAEVNKLSGRGVGLDAVLLALKRGEGDIHVRSTVGSGTEFRFWFRPPTSRPSAKKLLTYKALHNQLMGVISYQAEQERLAVRLDEEFDNLSSIETGLVYADEVQLMTAVSGEIGERAARASCEVKMSVTAEGEVRLTVTRHPLTGEAQLPEQYGLLKETFPKWIHLNGGSVQENPDGTVLITLGGAMTSESLPLLELHSTPDLVPDDFASVLKAVRVAGRSLGFEVTEPGPDAASSKHKLVLLAAYANYERKPGELAVHYQQHPAEIKSTLIAAMESVLRTA